MSSNLVKRILTCVIGVPFIAALIFLFPQYNFIGLSLFAIVMALLGSIEMSRILYGKTEVVPVVAVILPFIQYMEGVKDLSLDYCTHIFVLLIVIAMLLEIKEGEKDDFKLSIERVSKSVLSIIYPSYLMAYIIRLLAIESMNTYSVLLFLLLVFSNDIFAYVFGCLFGRNNAGIFKASPKKSVAGFIGGFVCCISLCLAYFAVFGENLPDAPLFKQILLAGGISIFANIGDLIESVFKRSAGVKDSGNIIPGRGGILDSTDSIMTAAPVFYFIFRSL